jgi:hypothetical protein
MTPMQRLTFDAGPSELANLVIVPRIDGTSLIELITAYEDARRFDVVGGYGGLIPAYFDYGPLDRYFIAGLPWSNGTAMPALYLLGCSCGEVGCWPLGCTVEVRATAVIWRDFNQEHRPNRDYSGFGPFCFDRADYLRAIGNLPKA